MHGLRTQEFDRGAFYKMGQSTLNHHVVLGPLAQLDHLREPGVTV